MIRNVLDIGGWYILGDDKKGKGLSIKTDKKHQYFFNNGRNALNIVLQNESFDIVFVCSYNCHTVINPFLNHNIDIEFININKNFEIDSSFITNIPLDKKVCVSLQNYFCNDQLQDIKKELKKHKNVTIIEDITHNMLDDRTFVGADYYVGSIRKWAGIGDGGILCTDKIFQDIQENDNEIIDNYKSMVPLQLEFYEHGNENIKAEFRKIQKLNDDLFFKKDVQKISEIGLELLNGLDVDFICEKRVTNFEYIIKNLCNIKPEIFPIKSILSGATPLYLPILVNNRDALQRFLFSYKIFFPIIWPKPQSVVGLCNDNENYIYGHILNIPIDQRYDTTDMERIVEKLREYFNI